MTVPLTESMTKMKINKKHWKDQNFNERFLAETRGRGISEFLYGGCFGTYGQSDFAVPGEHAS
jgi:hypothetical protein